MKRSYLENLYFKKRDDQSLRTYRKQKNYCSRSYHIIKKGKTLFSNLISVFVSDDKLFCKTEKNPFLPAKVTKLQM